MFIIATSFLTACSGVNFGTGGSDDSSAGASGTVSQPGGGGGNNMPPGGSGSGGTTPGGGGGGTTPGGGGGGTTPGGGGGGTTPGGVTPVYTISGPSCHPMTNCLVQFKLASALTVTFSFNWYTNDTLYGTPAPAGQYPYGQAGVDYISNANNPGLVTFMPGQTEVDVYVQDINNGGTAITIPVLTYNCKVNGVIGNCSDYIAH